MKLLLFSDLHRDRSAASDLLEMSKQADVMIGAGDFATCRKGVGDCIEILRRSNCPSVLVPGNGESVEELMDACKKWPSANVLHGNSARIDGIEFFGIGGGIPVTPFGSWSWDFDEQQAAELMDDCPQGCVLVSHSPPLGFADITSAGDHCGSSTIRQAIDRYQPRLVVCGHIHDSWGARVEIGKTIVINAGPQGVLFDL